MFASRVVVLGCGNVLFGDDAAGPLVIEALAADPEVPQDVALVDAGTGVRNLLFDLIVIPGTRAAGRGPERVILVDAATQQGVAAGEVREVDLAAISPRKISDMSLHLFPTVNLLQDLKRSTGMDVRIVTIQTGHVPETMDQRLSPEVRAALPRAVQLVKSLCGRAADQAPHSPSNVRPSGSNRRMTV